MKPITDAMFAINVMRELGYTQDLLNMYLKQRWYDPDGLITEGEWRTYCRTRAAICLCAYRRERDSNSVLALRLHANYKSWKEAITCDED